MSRGISTSTAVVDGATIISCPAIIGVITVVSFTHVGSNSFCCSKSTFDFRCFKF